MGFHRTMLLLTIASCAIYSEARSADPTIVLWTKPFSESIEWQLDVGQGSLLISTQIALYALGADDGTLVWQRDDLAGLDLGTIQVLPEFGIAMINRTKSSESPERMVACLDLTSGEFRWTTRELGIMEASGWFALGANGPIMSYVKMIDPNATAPRVGLAGRGKSAMVAIDISTGRLLWQKEDLFSYSATPKNSSNDGPEAIFRIGRSSILGNQVPVIFPDSTFLIAMSSYGISRHRVATGDTVWTHSFSDAGSMSLTTFHASILIVDSLRLAVIPKGDELLGINIDNGNLSWSEPIHFPNIVSQLQQTSEGLLVRSGASDRVLSEEKFSSKSKTGGGDRLALIETASGKLKWSDGIRKLYDPTNFIVSGDHAYICSGRQLHRIALAGGEDSVVGDSVVQYAEARSLHLAALGDSILAQSYERLILFDTAGARLYDTQYSGPGKGFVGALVDIAAFVSPTVNLIKTVATIDKPVLQAAWRPLWPQDPSDSYRVTVTKVDDAGSRRWGVAKINLRTGLVIRSIPTDDPHPDFLVNENLTRLWLISKDSQSIVCYQL